MSSGFHPAPYWAPVSKQFFGNTLVKLSRDLPVGRGFGNRTLLHRGTMGNASSTHSKDMNFSVTGITVGFKVGGITEYVHFNEKDAATFLLYDKNEKFFNFKNHSSVMGRRG